MATATISRPYLGSDQRNKSMILEALQKYDTESNRSPTIHEIVTEMCILSRGLDKQVAINTLSRILPRLIADGFVTEETSESILGVSRTTYRLTPKGRNPF